MGKLIVALAVLGLIVYLIINGLRGPQPVRQTDAESRSQNKDQQAQVDQTKVRQDFFSLPVKVFDKPTEIPTGNPYEFYGKEIEEPQQ